MHRSRDWRVRAHATDITSTGFSLHIDAFDESMLFSGGASWIAYPAEKVGVSSGNCRTAGTTPHIRPYDKGIVGHSGTVKLGTDRFPNMPRAFVAFSMLSV